PARIAAALVWIWAAFMGLNALRAIRITMRDARTQPSPNAGYPEAAFAGALGVRLGGVNFYRGVASRKSLLGDPLFCIDGQGFREARLLLYGSSLLMVILVAAVMR